MEPTDTRISRRINLLQQNKKQQVYGFTVLTAFVIIILSVGALKPSIETIVRLRSQIVKKEMILEKLEEKINVINSLSLQYEDFQGTASDLSLVFPDNGDFSLYLANIESITEESGFDLESVSFSKRKGKDDRFSLLKAISVQLSVRGRKQNLIPFLKTLEGLPMYPEVTAVSFSSDIDDDGNNRYAISITIYEVNKENFYESAE